MQSIFILFAFFVTLQSQAQVSQKISANEWAFYGQEFYQKLKSNSMEKEHLAKILNSTHKVVKGKHDFLDNSCSQNCYRHTSVGYDDARKIMFGELFQQKDDKGQFVVDVYCSKKFYFKDVDEVSNMSNEVNIEHTWPQSKFNRQYNKDLQKSDMHHLYPTDSLANSRRGNYDFGEIGNRNDELNVHACDISHLSHQDGEPVFTPPVKHKGNVARSLFYFSSHYDLEIKADVEKMLRKWHEEDPVDAEEIKRHEQISAHQNIRNPFVDHPELVKMVENF